MHTIHECQFPVDDTIPRFSLLHIALQQLFRPSGVLFRPSGVVFSCVPSSLLVTFCGGVPCCLCHSAAAAPPEKHFVQLPFDAVSLCGGVPCCQCHSAAAAPPIKYVAKLPSVPDVSVLMGRVHKDILAAYASCRKLTPQIEPEAVLEIKVCERDRIDPFVRVYLCKRALHQRWE
eukprot:1162036-Pelagomonas_calceolata.AAC.9